MDSKQILEIKKKIEEWRDESERLSSCYDLGCNSMGKEGDDDHTWPDGARDTLDGCISDIEEIVGLST